jgi:AhpD family alkylhydroperoxidase
MQRFPRRFYGPRGFLRDVVGIVRRRRQLRALMRGDLVDFEFRERLMLAVTGVNRCRYCAHYHAREALVAGLSDAEIDALHDGLLENTPPEQRPAVLYAQHWAESGGKPDPEARARLVERYGAERAAHIEMALRLIQSGNMMGNTLDALLYYASFGRLGGDEEHRPVRPPSAAS